MASSAMITNKSGKFDLQHLYDSRLFEAMDLSALKKAYLHLKDDLCKWKDNQKTYVTALNFTTAFRDELVAIKERRNVKGDASSLVEIDEKFEEPENLIRETYYNYELTVELVYNIWKRYIKQVKEPKEKADEQAKKKEKEE
jgi:hypothetical protein